MKTPFHQPLIIALLTLGFVAHTTNSQAANFESTAKKIESAMAAEGRPEKDVIRDSNRKPLETLEFFGLRDDMKIIELIPGGGWYTRILAPVMNERGDFSVAYGTTSVEKKLLAKDGFEKIQILAKDAKIFRPENARLYKLENVDLATRKADMILTFRNYHNFDEEGRRAMNQAAYDALGKGGIYAVVDHTRRHMEDESPENRRRFDPVKAISEIQAAGFELVDYSTLHFRPDDELRYEVGRKTVSGNTDRWMLKFRKVRK